jgi:hypothetical protein
LYAPFGFSNISTLYMKGRPSNVSLELFYAR